MIMKIKRVVTFGEEGGGNNWEGARGARGVL